MLNTDGSIEALNEFFAGGKELKFKRREQIIPAGIETRHAYWIVSGIVNIYSYDHRYNTTVHARYKESQIFPLSRILKTGIPGIGVSAFTDVVVRRREIGEFREFLNSHSEAMPVLVNQQSGCFEKIYMLNTDGAELRLAKWLSMFAENFGERQDGHLMVNHPITIQEVADTVRLSRESTGKILARFEDLKLISFGRKNIVVWQNELHKYIDSFSEHKKYASGQSSLSG